jgi:hypothetical protein
LRISCGILPGWFERRIFREQPWIEFKRLNAFQRDVFPEPLFLREKNDVPYRNDHRRNCHGERVGATWKPMPSFLEIIPCFGKRPIDPKAAACLRVEKGILVRFPLS